MLNSSSKINKILHIVYNKDGKSFEELLTEGIRQANLKAIYKQLALNATPKIKESTK